MVATKANDPFEVRDNLREAVEDAMSPGDAIEELPNARRAWLRA